MEHSGGGTRTAALVALAGPHIAPFMHTEWPSQCEWIALAPCTIRGRYATIPAGHAGRPTRQATPVGRADGEERRAGRDEPSAVSRAARAGGAFGQVGRFRGAIKLASSLISRSRLASSST